MDTRVGVVQRDGWLETCRSSVDADGRGLVVDDEAVVDCEVLWTKEDGFVVGDAGEGGY